MDKPENLFAEHNALPAALALEQTLADRIHVKRVHGVEFVRPGSLGQALGLPRIIHLLQHRSSRQRQKGIDELDELWSTLSHTTRTKVRDRLGWYDPHDLEWDDPRSNRFPKL